jgi:hypothetical protein
VGALNALITWSGTLAEAYTAGTITHGTQIEVWKPDETGFLILSFGSWA